MAELATDREIVSIPKIELHVHLGGSITEDTATELARRHGVDPRAALPLKNGRYPGRYRDFSHFLDTYLATNELVRTEEDLETVAAAFAHQQAAESIVYSEVIFTAMIYIRNGMEPAAMWRALRNGLAAAGSSPGPPPCTRLACRFLIDLRLAA